MNTYQDEEASRVRVTQTPSTARRKMIYLAFLVSYIITAHEHLSNPLSRDAWSLSQIATPAYHLGSLFRSLFTFHMRFVGKQLRRVLQKNEAHKKYTLNWMNLSHVYWKESNLSDKLAQAVATGIWSAHRRGVTMPMNTNNSDVITLQLRRIDSTLKNTDGCIMTREKCIQMAMDSSVQKLLLPMV